MRITGGAARGRILSAPRGLRVRPTSDKLRAAIFDILAARDLVADRRVLDLFCGSGALGLEALSRGASAVVFVDGSAHSCRSTARNVERSGYLDRSEIRRLTLPQGIGRLEASHRSFGGALLDPPYRLGLGAATLEVLGSSSLLEPGAWVVCEHALGDSLDAAYGRLRRLDTRRYGSTGLSMYLVEEDG
jgi:16S rRNA (guanine(966)-N(2))-methyltransferase RsmD